MTKMSPQDFAMPAFTSVFDFWAKQARFAVYMQNQALRAMMAPMGVFQMPSPCSPGRVVSPKPVEPETVQEAAKPVVETAAEVAAEEPVTEAAMEAPVETTETVTDAAAETVETVTDAAIETATDVTEATVETAADAGFALLDAPRNGSGDDLTAVKGVGPKLAEALNEVGIWHLDQLAVMTAEQAAWLDETIPGVRGRATRDDWAAQAKALIGA